MNPLQQFIADRTPDSWQTLPFWSLFQRVKKTGYADEELLSVYRDYGVIPKSSRDDNHNKESEDLSGYQLVDKGYLVTNKMKAWQGSIAISRYRGIVSPAYYVYKPLSTEHDDQFLHYLLRSENYIALYGRISKGVRVNQWDLEHEALRNIPVLFPSRERQKEIADFLDRETARIDQLIERKKDFFKALSEKLQTKADEIDTGVSDKSIRLRHLVRLNPGKSEVSYLPEECMVSFLPMEAIDDGFGGINELAQIKPLKEVGGSYTYFAEGDILLAKVTPCFENGKKAYAVGLENRIGFGTSELHILRISKGITPQYLMLLLSTSRFRAEGCISMTGAGGLKRVSERAIMNFKFDLPSLQEQETRVKKILKDISPIQKTKQKTNASIELLQKLKSSLITEAVTGQLDIHAWQKRGTGDRQLDQIEQDTEQEHKSKKARA